MTSPIRSALVHMTRQKTKHVTSHVVSWNLALEVNTPSAWSWASVHLCLAKAYNEAIVELALLHGV